MVTDDNYYLDQDIEEEEVIPDPNPQLIKLQTLLEQKDTLTRYKDLLEMEREVTLKRQFKRFMNIIGIEDQRVVDNYFPRFRTTLVVMIDIDRRIRILI